jgi:hypothetical protein
MLNLIHIYFFNRLPSLKTAFIFMHRSRLLWIIAFLLVGVPLVMVFNKKQPIDFNTSVKPILNKNCITCHGGVKRQAGFSLLFRQDALEVNKSGKVAIVPGDAAHSEMIRRLTLKDPEERMPYKHPALSANDIQILTDWINQGAKWGNHWAYIPIEKPVIPTVARGPWGLFGKDPFVNNNVDAYIVDQLNAEGLKPSPIADKATLLRRASLDVTGLPASNQLKNEFAANQSPKAYEAAIDQLLASPAYGERWAGLWMDLARYADTKGFEKDAGRNIWRYRDWLIQSFNADKPYNDFLIEQLAGDLLPNPTDAQYIATAFHRNTLTNDEGGTDNEEFRTAAVLDRVNTTWEALMGTTFACVQCHSHPYDPFRHEEYYKFMAFFNNTRDEDTVDEYPVYKEFKGADSSSFLLLNQWLQQHDPAHANEYLKFIKTGQPVVYSIAAEQMVNCALVDTKWLVMRNHASAIFKNVDLTNKSIIYLRHKSWKPKGLLQIHLDSINGPLIAQYKTPETKGEWQIKPITIQLQNANPSNKALTTNDLRHTTSDLKLTTSTLYFTFSNPSITNMDESGMQFDWFFFTNPFPGKDQPGYDSALVHFEAMMKPSQYVATPIMVENPLNMSRVTQVFTRGNWLTKGEVVKPNVPASLGKLPANAPANRLGMALWLTDKQNPLTARTIVNRIWEQFFGQGIAETLEDLGTQGIAPTHKELLDYLAYQLMFTYNWSLKKLMKEILMSNTYQQSSQLTPSMAQKDPYNKHYARGPRVRLTAEQIRDQALSVSGLLSSKMYGPSVMPFQPEGIWMSPYNNSVWKTSEGEDQYRRALYTFIKRSAPYPSMIGFDGTSKEVCTARRIRTNTPLQALNTLNDQAYIEAANHLAIRAMDMVASDPGKQIATAYTLALDQPISTDKLKSFQQLYATALKKFNADTAALHKFTGNDSTKASRAAMMVVTSALMNIDEFITKN